VRLVGYLKKSTTMHGNMNVNVTFFQSKAKQSNVSNQ